MIRTKAQFLEACLESGGLTVSDIKNIGDRQAVKVDKDWYDDVVGYEFDDGSLLSVFNDTVEVQ